MLISKYDILWTRINTPCVIYLALLEDKLSETLQLNHALWRSNVISQYKSNEAQMLIYRTAYTVH